MTKDWRRLADAVVRRRAELGNLTQVEIAQRGPLSLDRVQAIEGAKRGSYRRATLMALERALEWEAGSVDSVLAGGDPIVLPSLEPPAGPSNDELVTRARRALAELRADMEAMESDNRNRTIGESLIDALEAWVVNQRQ